MYLVVLPNFPGLLQQKKVLLAAPTSGYAVTELFIDTSLRVCSPRRVVPARALAYIVCTDELLDTRARSVAEMRLIGTLCTFVENATPTTAKRS